MGELIALMGAPGAGKSRLAASYPATVISLDVFRERDDLPGGAVIAAKLKKAQRLLLAGESVVFDSCLTHGGMRTRLLRCASAAQVSATLVYVDAPLEECLETQVGREHPVPADRVREIHAAARRAWERSSHEAWTSRERIGAAAPVSRVW